MSDEKELTGNGEGLSIAIIGMAARLPGAEDVESFCRNLRGGVESITFFSEEELKARGVDSAALHQPHFVKAAPVLERVGHFDAAFFGYSPREAELMDPQHRLFLECSWKALEHAGYPPARHTGATGVFAGSSLSSYLLFNLMTRADLAEAEDTFPVMVGNDKDFLATRVAYHLDLKGPAITVQTGCSSSLVATHMACQALLGYQCDMALAGGVSVHVPQRTGYFHQEGGINSPDGHCRAFDARAQGTLFGSGVGVVVLKRLEDAIADGDTIHAIIKGSAINNDGSVKVGYTAPGVEGQAEVIARAQAVAEVTPDSISYVEAHGTATQLGDPVEVEALTQAFRAGGAEGNGFCGLGSVKTNIGHLDAAAGVAGLLKTVLALEHRELPPSLHFEKPNPRIDFESSPFYVNASLKPWPEGPHPRRAGVSSFGIGGTNAHVILQEAPPPRPSGTGRPWQLLPLSAKTTNALEALTASLLAHLEQHPEQSLADVAWTLQAGRKPLEHRRAVLCKDREEALRVLRERDPQRLFTSVASSRSPSVAFLFAGGGAQHVDMGRGLYNAEPAFREAVDRCCELLRPRLGYDLRPLMYPEPERQAEVAQRMKRTSVALPALFLTEYAMARLWESWGVKPEALIGHSLGEYTAACLAGVFSLEDALALVVLRGQLFEELPGGGMLSLSLPEEQVQALLTPELSLAAVNGPSQCVVAGSHQAMEALAAELTRREVEFRQLQIDVAAHSHLVERLLGRFQSFVSRLTINEPTLPVVSNVTGTWLTPAEAKDPAYWARHLRSTVRFGEGLRTLCEQPERVLLEVGPSRTLSTLARLQLTGPKAPVVLASMRHPLDKVDDAEHLHATLGRLWLAGLSIDWTLVHQGEQRRRVPLPTYPFEGQEYWLAPEAPSARRRTSAKKSPEVAGWFYQPSWQRASLPLKPNGEESSHHTWLVFLDSAGVGAALSERLARQGHQVLGVLPGTRFGQETEGRYSVHPGQREDYVALLGSLEARGLTVDRMAHLWSLEALPESGPERLERAQEQGLHSVVLLAQALGEAQRQARVELWVAGQGALEVESMDRAVPERALVLAACKVIAQELEQVGCRYVDLAEAGERGAQQLWRELSHGGSEPVVAWRGPHRYVQAYESLRLEAELPASRPLRHKGVYLVTGGLGGVGLLLAGYLARTYQARLVLVGRNPLPPREQWPQWLAMGEKDSTRRRVQAVLDMEAAGAEVLVAGVDVADEARMRELLSEVQARFGALHGVIHAAGLAGERALALLSSLTPETYAQHFQAKVLGTQVLERVLQGHSLDFCLLLSSNASVLGGLGLTAYAAANTYLDSFASSRARDERLGWLSTNWDGWPVAEGAAPQTSIDQFAMSASEAPEAFRRVVESSLTGQVVVSTGPLEPRLAQWVRREAGGSGGSTGSTLEVHARPALGVEYVPPDTQLERTLAQAWQEALGLEQLGIHDNFFDLGGNSLLWLKVVGRLKKELRREVPLTSVFEAPTVAALAKLLGEGPSEPQTYEDSQSRGERRRERRNRRG
jgi:phthiocerol/phenolphthiocerol synthesis type-I polyketide synthase E